MRILPRSRPDWRRTAAGFLPEESGTVTIFAVIGFSICLVVAGLVFDVGRMMSIHTQVKSFADRIALATAAELDGRAGALGRAVAQAFGPGSPVGVGNRLTVGGTDNTITVRRLVFLSDLGADPTDPATPSPVAGDVRTATWTPDGGLVMAGGRTQAEADRDTRFVIVDPSPEREDYILFPLFGAFAPDMQTQARVASQSVAGFRQQICNSPPLMLCNPAEATNGAGAPFTFNRFQQIRAKIRTGSAALAPGDMKVINIPQGLNTGPLRRANGLIQSDTFCTGDTVPVRANTSLAAVTEGLNTRFDMFSPALIGDRNNGSYTPAPRAPKGFTGCSGTQSTGSTPLPRDNCFMPNRTWPNGVRPGGGTGCINTIMGNGTWNRDGYWSANYPASTPKPPSYASMSRYDVYRYEVTRGLVPNENRCSTSPNNRTTDPLRDRRVIPVAIVNCLSNQTGGNRDVPVEAYAEIFLTEPTGRTEWWNGAADDVYIEILGRTRDGLPETVQREYPVLVR